MNRNSVIFLIDESEAFEHYSSNGTKVIETTIDIPGKPLRLQIGVMDRSARLSDIIPLARTISDKLCSAAIDHLALNNQYVHCHKGCCACCNYLVPLSLPEVFRMQEEMSTTEAYRSIPIIYSCLESAKKILNMDLLKKHNINNSIEIPQISKWYAELELSCPFLSNGSCSIYEQRPLACREHMVTTSPEFCENSEMTAPETVDMPVSILEALGQLAADLEQTKTEAVILSIALTCMDNYTKQAHRTWPATTIVEHFVDILETMASKNFVETVTSI